MVNPWLIPTLSIVGLLVAIPCGAMGLLARARIRNINQFQTIYSFVIAPLYFLSGIFFPIDQMSVPVRFVAEFFPLIHGVRLAQSLFWQKGIAETFPYSGTILVIQSTILCTLAYIQIRKKLIS